jgi:hypothetical protein
MATISRLFQSILEIFSGQSESAGQEGSAPSRHAGHNACEASCENTVATGLARR